MWYNTLMAWILRSPLHRILSKSILLITVTGRKSGKTYTLPVNYVRQEQALWIVSQRGRTWWRNLQGEAVVQVRLAGKDLPGRGEVISEPPAVAQSLLAYLELTPQVDRYFGVSLDAAGKPNPQDCLRAAQERVMVRVELM